MMAIPRLRVSGTHTRSSDACARSTRSHWNARHELWIITRHADVLSIVRDRDSFSSAVIKSDARPLDDEGLTLLDEVRRFRGAQLIELRVSMNLDPSTRFAGG
jgi:hypothetical protein